MKKKSFIFISLLMGVSIISAACGTRAEPTPTIDPAAIMTEVSMTISAELTQVALLTPSPTPTLPPTATPPPIPTQALPPSSGQPAVLPTAVGPQPDNWKYISDAIPDGTVFWKNEKFTQTWKIENTGTTTWDSTYTLTYWDGEIMGDTIAVSIKNPVKPGVQVELSVPMVAPGKDGITYTSWWRMVNGKGQPFGEYLWVKIYVGTTADKTPTPSG